MDSNERKLLIGKITEEIIALLKTDDSNNLKKAHYMSKIEDPIILPKVKAIVEEDELSVEMYRVTSGVTDNLNKMMENHHEALSLNAIGDVIFFANDRKNVWYNKYLKEKAKSRKQVLSDDRRYANQKHKYTHNGVVLKGHSV